MIVLMFFFGAVAIATLTAVVFSFSAPRWMRRHRISLDHVSRAWREERER